jgi:hypothetical protein
MNEKAQLVIFLLQLGALWTLLAFVVKDYALDKLRQNLFTIRGRLFDEVLANGGSFSDPGYIELRTYINHVIRRGHTVTVSRSIIAALLAKIPIVTGGVSSEEINSDIEADVAAIDALEKKDERMKLVRREVHWQLAQYYALTSPIFLVAIAVLILVVTCTIGLMGVQRATSTAFDKFLAKDIERGISTEPCEGIPA